MPGDGYVCHGIRLRFFYGLPHAAALLSYMIAGHLLVWSAPDRYRHDIYKYNGPQEVPMIHRHTAALVAILMLAALPAAAQSLDGSPYRPGVDPDIDLYMNSWKNSEPRMVRGSLVVQDILTRGDNLNPPEKGAVLYYTKRFVHGALPPGAETTTVKLEREQEVYYILSGEGTIATKGFWIFGGKTADLYSGVAVLMPEGKEFVITSTGDEPLTMYIIAEPTPEGFTPRKDMLVKDENTLPLTSTTGHWTHVVKNLFGADDGLATMYSVLTVGHDPMTIGHPHSHNAGCEEVWTAISGTSIAFIGKQIRMQPPGAGYNIPPDGNTPHCNINTGDEFIKLLYFSVRKDIDGTGLDRPE